MANRLVDLLMKQGGVVTRPQLERMLGRAQVVCLVRRGELCRIRPGVYALPGFLAEVRADPARSAALDVAAVLVAKTGAGSHTSAARAYGMEFLTSPPPAVTITRPRRTSQRVAGARVYVADVPEDHLTWVRGAPMTTPARTVWDLSRAMPYLEAVVVADSALRKGLARRSALAAVGAYCMGWPGNAHARRVLEFATKKSGSVPESVARVVFAAHGLPAPRLQVPIGDEDHVAVVDFLWPEQRTVAEI